MTRHMPKQDYRQGQRQGRTRLIRLVHVRKKESGLDDDSYRDLLERETGKRSAADLSNDELERVSRVLGGVAKPARRAEEKKARALWIAAWNIGLTESDSEPAFRSFVKRQTGIDGPAWVRGDWMKVIEALKAWLSRDAGVDWEAKRVTVIDAGALGRQTVKLQINPRAAVAIAQWHRLGDIGAVHVANDDTLTGWLHRSGHSRCWQSVTNLDDAALDAAQRDLGSWIRRVMASRKAGT